MALARRVAVGASVVEFAGDAPLTDRFILALYHAAPLTGAEPTLRYRIETRAGTCTGLAPGRPPYGPASPDDVFAFLEWRATEDLLAAPEPGAVCVHAAGVSVGDRSVLIIGEPGAGKSTLAAHLATGGGRFWGDDVVRFALETEEFSAFPRSWRLDDNTLKDLDLVSIDKSDTAAGTVLAAGSWYVSPAAIRDDWEADPGRPDAVVLLDRSTHGRPAAVERVSDGEAALRVSTALLSAGAGQGPAWSAFMERVLAALRDVTAWRAVGSPPAALARVVTGAVAG